MARSRLRRIGGCLFHGLSRAAGRSGPIYQFGNTRIGNNEPCVNLGSSGDIDDQGRRSFLVSSNSRARCTNSSSIAIAAPRMVVRERSLSGTTMLIWRLPLRSCLFRCFSFRSAPFDRFVRTYATVRSMPPARSSSSVRGPTTLFCCWAASALPPAVPLEASPSGFSLVCSEGGAWRD
jgi:hypothetical protein